MTLRRLFGRGRRSTLIENPGVPLTAGALVDLFTRRSKAGVQVDEAASWGISAFWRGVQINASTIAGLPVDAERDDEVVPNEWLMAPHPFWTWPEFVELIVSTRMVHGNFYALKVRDARSNVVVRTLPLQPERVTPKLLLGQGERFPTQKAFDVLDSRGQVMTAGEEDILHIPGFRYNGTRGLGVLDVLRETLGLSIALQDNAAHLFGRGTLASGVLKTQARMEDEDVQVAKRRWRETVGGVDNAGDVIVMDMGLDFQQLTIPPEQAQFLESRNFSVREMARATGVPPHFLAAQDATMGSSIEQDNLGLISYTLDPHLTVIKSRIDREILPPETTLKWRTEKLRKGDSRARWGSYLIGRKAQALTVNEIRQAEGLGLIDDPRADDPFLVTDTRPANQDGGNEGEPVGPGSDEGTGDGTEDEGQS